jgi:cytochrome c-type biogenesis protein CcmH/NrfG
METLGRSIVWTSTVGIAILTYIAFGGYHSVKTYYALQGFEAHMRQVATQLPTLPPEEAIVRLKHLSLEVPPYPETYAHLGDLYAKLTWWEEARAAYHRAYQKDNAYALGYLNADFMAGGGRLSEEALPLLAAVLKEDPHNTSALNLKALQAFQKGDKEEAKRLWRIVRAGVGVDSPLFKTLSDALTTTEE